jgi:hypothetical protein
MNTEPRSTHEEVRVVLTLSVPLEITGTDPSIAPYYTASAQRVGDQVRHAIECYKAPVALKVQAIEVREEALLYQNAPVPCESFYAWKPAIAGGSPRRSSKPFTLQVCQKCGSSRIHGEVWASLDLDEIEDGAGSMIFCVQCDDHAEQCDFTEPLDGFDVARVFEYRAIEEGGDTFCEQVGDNDPVTPDVVRVLWSVYGHLVAGGVTCIADFDTEDAAVLYFARMEARYIQ